MGDNLIEETNSSGAAVARYSQWLNLDEPLAMPRSSTTSYYHADGLGSISSLPSSAGSLAQTYGYASFGKQTSSSGSLTNPYQCTAREFDPETSRYYYRARYYDPAAGRFVNEDPIRSKGGINFYAYVSNNPTSLEDPSGFDPCKPKCFAQLKYRPTDQTQPNGMSHAFWYVQGSDGKQFLITGGGVGGFLKVWVPPVSVGDPQLSAPVWWDSGLSSEICDGVDNMLKAARRWPENKIPYWWQGPNSNSAANFLGRVGGFFPTPPPHSTGWSVPVPGNP
jgi:RHS repeat-associated protein